MKVLVNDKFVFSYGGDLTKRAAASIASTLVGEVVEESGISFECDSDDEVLSLRAKAYAKESDPLLLEYQRKLAAEYPDDEVEVARQLLIAKDVEIKQRFPKSSE